MIYKLSSLILLIGTHITITYCLEDADHWKRLAEEDIINALLNKVNNNTAKNVIIFIGDGLDLNTVTTSRIYKYGEENHMSFDKFSHLGLLKTYSANKLVPDSSSTATALFCGVKSNHRTTGVTPAVQMDDCETSLKPETRLKCIMDWAQASGKATGFVTTTRVTHATPSALYAHSAQRKWECEDKMKGNARKCKDIARQLIEDEPGKNLNVIFGGGRQCLQSFANDSFRDPTDGWCCYRKDGRNLIQQWEIDKMKRNVSHKFVENRGELLSPDIESKDFVLGIFANSHLYLRNDNGTLNVRQDRGKGPDDQPSIKEMTASAIKVLRKNKKGFILMVEGGLIDYAHHRGRARAALDETIEFSEAIQTAVDMTEQQSNETLIIVTSDHTHSLVFSGYPSRSQGVLGIAQQSKWDNVSYTTLLYGTGGPNNYQFEVINGSAFRKNPQNEDTASYEYSQQTGVVTDETTHGGADVVIYAKGPMAHLFHHVHEQTYVAYVVGYAAKIGPYGNTVSTAVTSAFATDLIIVLTILVTWKYTSTF